MHIRSQPKILCANSSTLFVLSKARGFCWVFLKGLKSYRFSFQVFLMVKNISPWSVCLFSSTFPFWFHPIFHPRNTRTETHGQQRTGSNVTKHWSLQQVEGLKPMGIWYGGPTPKCLRPKIKPITSMETVCPLFWGFNPPKQGPFQSKQGSFGF